MQSHPILNIIIVLIKNAGDGMLEKDLLRFEKELGKIKQDLIKFSCSRVLDDEESYKIATKLDLTVARMMRILEYR